ncbi:N-acetylglucosamine-6-phosphate deacetylase [Posidoniimonas polymericola]|uniref:N-acetylglucosamine-6-phosphate deacetylase n=1 Tax=Posidoniimonas polymericola TaxID=2528002 RepID=A0A5C5YT95_9BACT|nr:N-acetylglucosamine-6-phosphate deacetylase [Posidoniimonas polymericola]TWT78222.1 N-acetylglucosamine-6-phosphate deacetylase [Posidoniimonas polymericola]
MFDIQVNGYGGVDFNADGLSVAEFERACERLEADGVGAILATVITTSLDAMSGRIRRIAEAVEQSAVVGRVIRGIHVEGPFISGAAGYVGAHPTRHVLPATPDAARRLVDAGAGLVKLLTLAPEHDAGHATTRSLVDSGVVVAAGHCNPALDELDAAIDAGLSMFTHLGNGCPREQDRHDNIINRVLSRSRALWVCFIADGVHVPLFALRNYLSVVGVDRAIVVSDAIAAAGQGPGVYSLSGMDVVVDEDLATWSADRKNLMGSACPLPLGVANLVERLGVSEDDATRMTHHNPWRALGGT